MNNPINHRRWRGKHSAPKGAFLLNSKHEIINSKQITMTQITNPKKFDLENRTLNFARRARVFVKIIPKTMSNFEDGKQLIRSSGSVGANYIEANESLSKKDFIMRIKICKKESKESCYWLRIIDIYNDKNLIVERINLINESIELMKIFGSIIEKTKQ